MYFKVIINSINIKLNYLATKAYDDLVCILKHPKFKPDHVVKNVRRLRLLRNRLPLQIIKKHSVPIKNMKTPSTSTPFKDAYTISIIEHIKRVLSNSFLYSQMYFGPGIEANDKSEFWHGNVWQESPLFGQSSIEINKGKYFSLIIINFKHYYHNY